MAVLLQRGMRCVMRSTRFVPLLVGLLVGLVVFVSACGSNDETGSGESDPIETPAAVLTAPPASAESTVAPSTTAIPDPTSTPLPGAPATPSPPATPDPADSWWRTSDAEEIRERAQRVQVGIYGPDAVWELDSVPPARLVGDYDVGSFVGWVGPDRSLVLSTPETLRLWSPAEGVFAETACVECWNALVSGTVVFVVVGGEVVGYSGVDLTEVGAVSVDLPPHDPDVGGWVYPVALHNDDLIVVRSATEGTSAYGGPEALWAVDLFSGQSRVLVDTESNVGTGVTAVSPDGTTLAIAGFGARGGYCAHTETVELFDLASNERRHIRWVSEFSVWDDSGSGDQRILDVFFTGEVLHAVVERYLGPECETEIGPALYRYNSALDVWDIIDWGPLTSLRPVASTPPTKVVTVNDGDVYWELDGAAQLVATEAWIATSAPLDEFVDLRPANSLGLPDPTAYVEPWGDLVGAHLQDDAEEALAKLIRRFGEPTEDTGWGVGCPLDGDDINERSVRWGSLSAEFVIIDGRETFTSWSFVVDDASGEALPGGPQADRIQLPAGLGFDTSIATAAERLRMEPQILEDFQTANIWDGGFQLLANGTDVNLPIRAVGVPFLAVCE